MKDHALDAKKAMLSKLAEAMAQDDDMGLPEALKGKKMQKVTVAADSPEALSHGLDKAKEIMEKRKAMMGMDDEEASEDETPEEDALESPEDEAAEHDDDGDIHSKIAKLEAELAALKSKK